MKLSLLACTLPFSRDIQFTLALLFWNCLKHSQVKEKTAILLRSQFLERGNQLKMHKNSVLKEERQTF